MARVREILLPWDNQPQEAVEVRDGFAHVWLPQYRSNLVTGVEVAQQVPAVAGQGGLVAKYSTNTTDRPASTEQFYPTISGSGIGPEFTASCIVTSSASNSLGCFLYQSSITSGNGFGHSGSVEEIHFYATAGVWGFSLDIGEDADSTDISGGVDVVGKPTVLTARYEGNVQSLFVDGVLVNSRARSAGTGYSGSYLRFVGTGTGSTTRFFKGSIELYAMQPRGLSDEWIAENCRNPAALYNGVFAPQTIWVPVSAGGGGPTTAAITAAAGASTASALTGSATATATTTQAAGTSTASMAGSSVAAAAITQASGVATASTIAGGLTAVGAITQADGVATAGTMAASAVAVSAFSAAPGAATGETLAGSGLTAGASSITPAAGASTASSLAGSSTAASAISPAAGAATASTISASVGVNIVSASMVPSAGVATASEFAASAVAATVAIASAGASAAQAMAATAQAVADFVAAAGVATAETMVDFDSSVPVLGSLVGSTRKVGMGRPASVSSIARTSRQPLIR